MTSETLVWGLELYLDNTPIASILKRRLPGKVLVAIASIYNLYHPASILNNPSIAQRTLTACISIGIVLVHPGYSNIYNEIGEMKRHK